MSPMPRIRSRRPPRVEHVQIVQALARADEFDRHPGDRLHRDCRPAPGVAVELGEDHSLSSNASLNALALLTAS